MNGAPFSNRRLGMGSGTASCAAVRETVAATTPKANNWLSIADDGYNEWVCVWWGGAPPIAWVARFVFRGEKWKNEVYKAFAFGRGKLNGGIGKLLAKERKDGVGL